MCDCLVRSEYACLPGEVICCMDNTYVHNDIFGCTVHTSRACDRFYCEEGSIVRCSTDGGVSAAGECGDVDFSGVSSCECVPVAGATSSPPPGSAAAGPDPKMIIAPVTVVVLAIIGCIIKKRRDLAKEKTAAMMQNPMLNL